MNTKYLFSLGILVFLFLSDRSSANTAETSKCVVKKVASDYQESVLVLAQTKLLLVMLAGKEISSEEIWQRVNLKSSESLSPCPLEELQELKSALSGAAIEGWKLLVSDEFVRERAKFKSQVYRFEKKLVEVAQLLSKMAFQLGTSTFRTVNIQLLTETFETTLQTIEAKQILSEITTCTELTTAPSTVQKPAVDPELTPIESSPPVTIDEEVHRLYPACRNETDLFSNNRLTGFFKALKNEPSEVHVEAYGALLRVILKSQYICTQDYVELAFQVHTFSKKSKLPEDQRAWTELKSRFNPKVFKLFEYEKLWRIASVSSSGHGLFATNGNVTNTTTTSPQDHHEVLKKYTNSSEECLEKAFKWRILADEDYFMIRSVYETYFRIGQARPDKSELEKVYPSKLRILPTAKSVTDTKHEFQFHLVSYENGQVSTVSNDNAMLPFDLRETSFALKSIEKSLKGAEVYTLEKVPPPEVPTNASIAEIVKQMYPKCTNESSQYVEYRLSELFQFFDTTNDSATIEAYKGLMTEIIASKPRVCTFDYVQLAYRALKEEQKSTALKHLEAEGKLWTDLKLQFNPLVFQLFNETAEYRIVSVDNPEFAVFATNSSVKEFPGYSRIVLKRRGNSTDQRFKWRPDLYRNGNSLRFRSGFDDKLFWSGAGMTEPETGLFNTMVLPSEGALVTNSSVFDFRMVIEYHASVTVNINETSITLPVDLEGDDEFMELKLVQQGLEKAARFRLEMWTE